MTNHTPGPWVYHAGSVYVEPERGDLKYRIAMMDRDEEHTRPVERDDNARLIAAAPDLLEAVKRLLCHVGAHGMPQEALEHDATFAEQAIAKAKGDI